MAAHATHSPMHIRAGASTWRRSRSSLAAITWVRAWKFAIAGLVAVSLAGAVALLAGLDSGVGALVTATAAIAAGVLAHMIPGPSAAEVLRPTRKEAF